MRILMIAAFLVVAAIGGCDGDNGDKATPQAGWSYSECQDARKTLDTLTFQCRVGQPGACEAVAQLQADINDNCD